MPIWTSKEALRFEGSTSGLERYLEDIKLICEDRQKNEDDQLIKWGIYYTDEKSANTWTTVRDGLPKPPTWKAFKEAIQEIYPEAQLDCHHTIAALRAITNKHAAKVVSTKTGLAEYHHEFSGTANYLMSKHCMMSCEASIMYMSTFPASVRPNITAQLTIKCPDVHPDNGYNLKDMMNAAQFIISSQPAIDLLATTTPLQPSVPVPVPQPPMAAYVMPAATPYVPDPPSSYTAQPYQQQLQYDGCTFCGASDHAIAACTVKAKYACLGKIKIVNGHVQLLDGNSPFFEPYRSHSRFIQAQINRWILENPQQAPQYQQNPLIYYPPHIPPRPMLPNRRKDPWLCPSPNSWSPCLTKCLRPHRPQKGRTRTHLPTSSDCQLMTLQCCNTFSNTCSAFQ